MREMKGCWELGLTPRGGSAKGAEERSRHSVTLACLSCWVEVQMWVMFQG